MDCLLEVKGGCPSALVWLKRNVDFEVCDIMLRDWKHSGKSKYNQMVAWYSLFKPYLSSKANPLINPYILIYKTEFHLAKQYPEPFETLRNIKETLKTLKNPKEL